MAKVAEGIRYAERVVAGKLLPVSMCALPVSVFLTIWHTAKSAVFSSVNRARSTF